MRRQRSINDPEVVGLESNDGLVRIQISRVDAEKSMTLRNLIEDVGTDNYITLRNTNGTTLLLLEKFMKTPDALVAENLSGKDLLNLLETANYLDYSDLMYHLMPAWVNSDFFPGRYQTLKWLIPKALYFFNATGSADFLRFPLDPKDVEPFRQFVKQNGLVQWAIKFACQNGETEVVRQLLKNPLVDPSPNVHGYNLLFTAGKGPQELLRILLNHPSYRNLDHATKWHLLQRAVEESFASLVSVLLESDVNYNLDASADDNLLIVLAARNGNLGIVRRLLRERNVDPGARGNGALIEAVQEGHLEVVAELLFNHRDRVDPSVNYQMPLYYAASRANLPMVKLLLKDKRVNPTDNRYSNIIFAALLLKDERVNLESFLQMDPNNPKVQELYQEAKGRRERRRIEARVSYIGLKDPTAVPPIDDDDIVELQDVHGNRIQVARANAERSQTLRNLIEDAGTDNPIPLPNVRGRALWSLETILNLPPGQEYDGTRLNDDALLDLLVAATFLDLENLIYQLLPVWAGRYNIFPNFLYFNHLKDQRDARHSLKALVPKALYFVRPESGRAMRSILFDLPNLGVNIPDKLLRQFEEFDVYQYDPDFVLKVAARNGEVGVVNQLLKNPKLNPNDAFLTAVAGGHLEVTKRMLQDTRVDPTIRLNAALTLAARRNYYDIVKLLLANERVDPTILADFSDPRIQELYQDAMKKRSAKTRLEAPLCISCRVPGKAVMACGQCMEAVYCGYACQRADWTHHAAHCATKK